LLKLLQHCSDIVNIPSQRTIVQIEQRQVQGLPAKGASYLVQGNGKKQGA